jgi:hypothetical protein
LRHALVCALLPVLAALPGFACVTAEDATTGVRFTLADGAEGTVQVSGQMVALNYATNKGARIDERQSRYGIYDVKRLRQDSELPVVGSGADRLSWFYQTTPPRPEPGMVWHGTLRQELDQVGYGTEMVELHSRSQVSYGATWTVLEGKEVTLSGCPYRVLPVEMTRDGETAVAGRWIWFAELGFGIQTIREGKSNGITGLTAP